MKIPQKAHTFVEFKPWIVRFVGKRWCYILKKVAGVNKMEGRDKAFYLRENVERNGKQLYENVLG